MKSDNKNALLFIADYLKHHWTTLVIGFSILVVSILFQVLLPLIVGATIDFIRAFHLNESFALPKFLQLVVVPGAEFSQNLIRLATILVAVAVLLAVTRSVSRIMLINISRHIEYEIRNDYLQHLQSMSQHFFQHNKTGDLMARATNDLHAIRHMIGPGITQALNTFVMFAFTLFFMIRIDSVLTFVALSPLPFVILIVYSLLGKIDYLFERIQDQFARLTAKAQENFSGIRVVKSYVREPHQIETFRQENQQYVDRNLSMARIRAFLHGIIDFLLGLAVILVIWLGGRQVINGETSLGQLVALLSYVTMLAWPMIAIGWLLNLWQQGLTSTHRIRSILMQEPEIRDSRITDWSVSSLSGDIEFQHVSFQYSPDEPEMLHDISFTVPKGSTLAVVGRTGSGKSTLVHLLPRLIEVTSGRILIDGHDIRTIPLKVLREHIGFVQQESFLFSDSLADNISFGLVQVAEDDIRMAAETSQLQMDIDQFPKGLDTMVGERGITLSGGQKQRTSISRAIIKNPAMLVLDDALSSVDTYTEEEILKRIRPIMEKRTTILVAHRISTIREADQIIVLDRGQIAERGTHEELLRYGGIYADMHERQQLEESLRQLN